MLAAALAFFCGTLSLIACAELPTFGVWLTLAGITALLAGWRRRAWPLFWLLGFLWSCNDADLRLRDRLLPVYEGVPIQITGVIAATPAIQPELIRFTLRPLAADRAMPLPHAIRLNWYRPSQTLQAGEIWRMTVKLKRPHGLSNPGGFDYEQWLFVQHIGATGYVRASPPPLRLGVQNSPLQQVRAALADALARSVTTPATGVMQALAVGWREEISPTLWEVFRRTGTVHLVAISGLHIGLIAGLVYALSCRGWAYCGGANASPPQRALWSAGIAASLYALLAGMSVPTQRAWWMSCGVLLALSLRRQFSTRQALALALFGVLLTDPAVILQPGFCLSFAAVALMGYVLTGRLQTPRGFRSVIAIHIVTALGLLPLLALFFQQWPLAAPLANVFAVPWVSFLIVPALLASLVIYGVAPQLAVGLWQILAKLVEGLIVVLQQLAAWPWAVFTVAPPTPFALVCSLVGVLWLLAPRGWPARWLGAVLLLPLLVPSHDAPPPGALRLTVLDVGQGLAVLAETAQHRLLFDTGARYAEDFDMGGAVIVPFLRAQAITGLDILIISHGDNDHSGGAATVLRNVPVARVLTSAPEWITSQRADACQIGQRWQWDGVQFSMLSPPPLSRFAGNNASCVLHIATPYGSVLLTGDIEAPVEHWLVQQYRDDLRAEVLVAPHHGSKTSSSWTFLRHVQAQTVLIPSGYRNRFGFPHAEVVARYCHLGMTIFDTATHGAIRVDIDRRGIRTEAHREAQRRYWHSE